MGVKRSFGCALALAICPSPAAAATPSRDLNHNGRLDPYEDARRPIAGRVEDLLRRMTIEEKVGSMLHGTLPSPPPGAPAGDGGYDLAAAGRAIDGRKITSFITRLAIPPQRFAAANNAIQKLAEGTRLGIPVTISTDPRNHFQVVLGVSVQGAGFSTWPETLGLAAIGDPALVRRFGRLVAAEYRAVGIHMALSPQADLATEPRWPRVTATFGSDPAAVSALAGAYVKGFQGGAQGLARGGVATVVKHWVGYGAEPDGFDGHNRYGRIARLDNASFAQHVAAFAGALRARSSGVMPTYVIADGVTLDGRPLEPVGAGFSRDLIGTLLRGRHGFRGIVVSDWGITSDCPKTCMAPTAEQPQGFDAIGMPWGVETLSQEERFAKGVDAGIDQFGGFEDPAPLLAAVRSGKTPVTRIDESVRRVLTIKFQLGLFDNPYVDPDEAARRVGAPAVQAEADAAQRAAIVLLENRAALLPLKRSGARVWLSGVAPEAARAVGLTVVATPDEAEFAIVRAATPSEKLHPHHLFGSRQNEGRLDFRAGDPGYDALVRAAARVPTIFAVDMDRPAILTEAAPKAGAVLVLFGASDAALIDVVTGRAAPRGRMPFELPRSMAAVAAQDPARPDDSAAPPYPRGAGLPATEWTRRAP